MFLDTDLIELSRFFFGSCVTYPSGAQEGFDIAFSKRYTLDLNLEISHKGNVKTDQH